MEVSAADGSPGGSSIEKVSIAEDAARVSRKEVTTSDVRPQLSMVAESLTSADSFITKEDCNPPCNPSSAEEDRHPRSGKFFEELANVDAALRELACKIMLLGDRHLQDLAELVPPPADASLVPVDSQELNGAERPKLPAQAARGGDGNAEPCAPVYPPPMLVLNDEAGQVLSKLSSPTSCAPSGNFPRSGSSLSIRSTPSALRRGNSQSEENGKSKFTRVMFSEPARQISPVSAELEEGERPRLACPGMVVPSSPDGSVSNRLSVDIVGTKEERSSVASESLEFPTRDSRRSTRFSDGSGANGTHDRDSARRQSRSASVMTRGESKTFTQVSTSNRDSMWANEHTQFFYQTKFSIRREWCDQHVEAVTYWEKYVSLDIIVQEATKNNAALRRTSRASAFQEMDTKRFVLHPGGHFRLMWNALCLLLILYDVLMMPMQAFGVGVGQNGDSLFFGALEWSCTLIWTMDLILTFRTGFFVGSHLEMRPLQIAYRYAQTSLIIDLVVVAVEWASRFENVFGSASVLRTTRVFRMFRFVKLLRIAKLRDLWMGLKEQVNSNMFHLVITMSIMTLLTLIAIHIVACIWYAIGKNTEYGWITYDAYEGKTDLVFWYLASARWSIAQLNGRTDMDDRRNMIERGFTCVAGISLAVISKAVFTSVITKTMLDLSDLRSERTRRRRIVNEYLEHHHISAVLVANVKSYLRDYQDADKENKKEEQVLEILPKHVQADLLCEIRAPILANHLFFRHVASNSHAAMRQLSRAAVNHIAAVKTEVIFDKGDPCSRMIFLQEGHMLYGEPTGKGAWQYTGDEADLPSTASTENVLQVWSDKDLRPMQWIAEPGLWVDWTNHGRLIADCLCHGNAVDAFKLAEVLLRHVDVYAASVLYARTFLRELRAVDTMCDIIDFQVLPTVCAVPPRLLAVTIVGATGLRNADSMSVFGEGKSDPYCICRIAGLSKQVAGETFFRTEVEQDTMNPIWERTFSILLSINQSLEFEVWDKDTFRDELLGKGSLHCSCFSTDTFNGELILQGAKAQGTLRVRIAPMEMISESGSDGGVGPVKSSASLRSNRSIFSK